MVQALFRRLIERHNYMEEFLVALLASSYVHLLVLCFVTLGVSPLACFVKFVMCRTLANWFVKCFACDPYMFWGLVILRGNKQVWQVQSLKITRILKKIRFQNSDAK